VSIRGDGVFYLPLVQNLLAHDRTEAMRHHRQVMESGTLSYTSVESLVAREPEGVRNLQV
jgi:hypothetical protein